MDKHAHILALTFALLHARAVTNSPKTLSSFRLVFVTLIRSKLFEIGLSCCSPYLPTLVFVYAGQFHSFCFFAGQYCTAVKLILSQLFRKSCTKLRHYSNFTKATMHILTHSLRNGSLLMTHWHSSCHSQTSPGL